MLTYPSPTEGQAAVRAGNISAFITDWPVVTYMAQQQPCDLTVGSDTFGPGALVLGLPKNSSSLAQALNTALLNLIEEGFITSEWGCVVCPLYRCCSVPSSKHERLP